MEIFNVSFKIDILLDVVRDDGLYGIDSFKTFETSFIYILIYSLISGEMRKCMQT